MMCSLAIVDTAIKRRRKIEDKDQLREYNEVFNLSLCHHYKEINRNMDTIISEIYDGEELSSVNDKIESEKQNLSYRPNEISLMKKVVVTFYKHEKYYLD